jgi:hypothetical protein
MTEKTRKWGEWLLIKTWVSPVSSVSDREALWVIVVASKRKSYFFTIYNIYTIRLVDWALLESTGIWLLLSAKLHTRYLIPEIWVWLRQHQDFHYLVHNNPLWEDSCCWAQWVTARPAMQGVYSTTPPNTLWLSGHQLHPWKGTLLFGGVRAKALCRLQLKSGKPQAIFNLTRTGLLRWTFCDLRGGVLCQRSGAVSP